MYFVGREATKELIRNLDVSSIDSYADALGKVLQAYSSDPTKLPKRTVYESDAGIHLVMPSLAGSNKALGLKMLTGGKSNGFNGITIVMDEEGMPSGMMDALHPTAFRTALTTKLAWQTTLTDRQVANTSQITTLGSGLQAFYHTWLAAKVFPLQKIVLWNRSLDNAQQLKKSLTEAGISVPIEISTNERLANDVRASQVVCGCIPSLDPVLQHEWLAEGNAQFVSLIGSYKPTMHELSASAVTELLKTGSILVDSAEMVLDEAGEVIDANAPADKLVEIGAVLSNPSLFTRPEPYILWKCVGLSVMDVAVGEELIKSAKNVGLGMEIPFD